MLAQSVNGHLVVVSLRDFRKNNLCDPGQDQQQVDDRAGAHAAAGKIGDKNCDPYDAGRADAENKHPYEWVSSRGLVPERSWAAALPLSG